jgi:hypothetical protein
MQAEERTTGPAHSGQTRIRLGLLDWDVGVCRNPDPKRGAEGDAGGVERCCTEDNGTPAVSGFIRYPCTEYIPKKKGVKRALGLWQPQAAQRTVHPLAG